MAMEINMVNGKSVGEFRNQVTQGRASNKKNKKLLTVFSTVTWCIGLYPRATGCTI
jgi:hypothetical protein